jgi:flagellar hook protein FlgE
MPADLMGTGGIHNKTLEITVGSVTRKYLLDATGTLTAGSGVVKVDATGSMKEMLDVIQADLRAYAGAGASGATVNWDTTNGLVVDFPGNYRSNVSIAGTAAAALNVVGSQNAATGTLSTVSSANSELFVKESISGGGITVYSQTGEPVNVQMRWAKVSDEAGIATWSLFYASDSAPGSANAWTKMADYTFDQGVLSGISGGSGVTASGTERINIGNLSINGRSFGSITIDHGLKGMTQFADNSGMATTTQLKQDGYGAGEFISVGISDEGQVIASYTNGETRAVAQIVTASFSNPNALKRGDGGTYTATTESGEPIIDQSGAGIVGSSTEASNTDISEEFTKLIVTQQAYSANTKIVTAADEMLKEALNMIR